MTGLLALAIVVAIAGTGSAQQTPARDRATPVKGTAIIKGHVIDEHTGTPIRRAVVTVSSSNTPSRGSAVTDDDGRFEVRDLPTGKYAVFASRSGYLDAALGRSQLGNSPKLIDVVDGTTTDKIVVSMSKGGVIAGRVLDEHGEPIAGIDVRAMQYRYESGARRLLPIYISGSNAQTDDLGGYRLYGLQPGRYYVSAEPRNVFPPIAPQLPAPITTYYPNAPDPEGAQRVTVAAGKEITANITLATGRAATVRGRAVMSTGEPFAGSTLTFVQQTANGTSSRSRGAVRADGTFESPGVPPGNYLITVRPRTAREGEDVEIARTRVVVNGADLDDVVLIGARGATVFGRVVADEGGPLPLDPRDLQIEAINVVPEDRISFLRPASVADDFSFELKGLFGRMSFGVRVMANPVAAPANRGRWAFKGVFWRGEDVTENPIDFQPGQAFEGLEIVFTRRWSQLSGTVTDERGQTVGDAWVLIFADDENKWVPQSRFVKATRTNAKAEYRMPPLHPHSDYLIIVVPDMEPNQWQDPEFLQSIRDRATRLSLAAEETKVHNLRIARSAQ